MMVTISASPTTVPVPGARSTIWSGTACWGLNLFPAEVARKEMDFYKKMQNDYGLPLDNRETYTQAGLDHLDRHADPGPRRL